MTNHHIIKKLAYDLHLSQRFAGKREGNHGRYRTESALESSPPRLRNVKTENSFC